ncbi:PAS domain-containing protein [Aureimonas sp. AU20]|uniref:PAS domain-containing protein n=1 Tax=Aureimonas sp. AU20 TaxID=1349819 RepID=UPI000722F2F4|nr:PAS domain-containing protein [Aureimonas sp. AU20]ALN75690.1 hypothetical protein M673_23380 [Aureimonas sp. AU20]
MNLPTKTVPIVNLMEPQQTAWQSDAALADADRVQLALAAGAIIGTWFWDIQADRFTIDEAFAAAFGLDPALSSEGIPLAQIVATVHPDDQAGLAAAINEAVGRGGAYAHEYRVRRHTGRYHWLEANGRVEHGPDGTPMRFSGVLIDAASRRLERILRELSERLRSLDDPQDMALLASETVGKALDLSRVAYGDMDAAGRHIVIEQDWLADGQASLAGTHDFETYGSYIKALRRGEDVVIDDVATDPRTIDQAANFRSIKVRSLANLPLMDRDHLKVVLCLNQDGPRVWSSDEVLFARRVMDRTEVEIARRAAEHRLRELNADLERQVAAQTAERDRIWQLCSDMLGVADDKGVWLSINPAWTRTLGWRQEEIVGHTSQWMEHPDDVAKTRAEIGHLASGHETFEFENRLRSKDRGYRTLSWTAVPENGLLYCIARDVTDERAQEAAIAEQTAQQDRTWRFSPDLLSVIDMPSGAFDRVNPAWMTALGWNIREIEGKPYNDFVHPDDVAASLTAFERVRAGHPVLQFENRYRMKAGGWRRLSWVAFPEGDKLYSSARDITTETEQAAALVDANELIAAKERAERQQRELQNEMAHRIKNTLSMVKAIVSQTMRHAETKQEAAVTIDQRIAALSNAQDLLRQTTYSSATIHEVVRGALKVHLESDDRVTIKGVRLDLPSQAALGLSLAIHELATNATKYGALSNDTGHIRISWRQGADGAFRFEWREEGGPEVVKPARRGFGSRLTNQIVPSYFEGSGETAFTPEGLCYVLNGKLPTETPTSPEPSPRRPVADHG